MSAPARRLVRSGIEYVRLNEVAEIQKIRHEGAGAYAGLEHISNDTGEFLGSHEPKSVKSATFQFGPGHVLYGRLRAYLNKVLVPDFEGHCSSEIFPIRPGKALDRRYLFYWLTWEKTCDCIAATATGTRMPRANMNEVMSFRIPLPPLEEQKRIVAILDQAFAALDRARAHAEANLADAAELFKNVLLATFGELLAVSDMRTLCAVAEDFSRGKSRHRPRNDPKLYGGKYPFIQTGDIRRSDGSIREFSQTYNEQGLAQSKLWPAGTVCITIAANIAETGVLEFDGCFPDSVIGVVPNSDITTAHYVEYMLRYFANDLKQQGKGSAQDNINLATFEKARFPFPPLVQQLAVVAKLDSVAEKVFTLRACYEQKLTDIADLRRSLLQKAFAGELSQAKTAQPLISNRGGASHPFSDAGCE